MKYNKKQITQLIQAVTISREIYDEASFWVCHNRPPEGAISPHVAKDKLIHKKPILSGWCPGKANFKIAPIDRIQLRLDQGFLLSVVPWTIGYAVVDIDMLPGYDGDTWDAHVKDNPADAEAELEAYMASKSKPCFITRSQKAGRRHLWFKDNNPYKNGKLECGDLRSSNGVIVLWQPKEFLAGITRKDAKDNFLDRGEWGKINKANVVDVKSFESAKGDSVKGEGGIKGSRNDTLNNNCFFAGKANDTNARDAAIAAARAAGLDETEIANTANSGWTDGLNDKDTHQIPAKGSVGLRYVMNCLGMKARYNTLTFCEEIFFEEEWENLDKRLTNILITETVDKFYEMKGTIAKPTMLPWKISSIDAGSYFSKLANRNKFNPIVEYFRGLGEDCETDITCDNFLVKLFDLEDTAYNRAAGRIMALSLVTRSLLVFERNRGDPKKSVDVKTCIVLQGEGDSGKTAFVKLFLPEQFSEHISQNIDLKQDDMIMMESIANKLVTEIQELGKYGNRNSDDVKGFLSRGTDSTRRKYIADGKVYARTTIFIGTTNNDVFIANDEAMALRYYPVQVKKKKNTTSKTWIGDFMNEHRGSIFRSAVKLYDAGVSHEIPDELSEEHKRVTSQFTHENEDVSMALDAICEVYSLEIRTPILTVIELAKAAQLTWEGGGFKRKKDGVHSASLAKAMEKDERFISHGKDSHTKSKLFQVKKEDSDDDSTDEMIAKKYVK